MSAVTCPECGAAAEITERFTLASTDGPVAHVALSTIRVHRTRPNTMNPRFHRVRTP